MILFYEVVLLVFGDLENWLAEPAAVRAVLLLVVLVTLAVLNLASWAGLVVHLPEVLAPPPIDVDLHARLGEQRVFHRRQCPNRAQ